MAIVYPNKEYGGVYNLGMHIIYELVNSLGWKCEKRYIDAKDLSDFDLVGFSWQFELDYRNIIKLLEQAKGVSFCGGPCTASNFRILENEIDFFVIGDVENIMKDILENYNNKQKLSKIKGVFVPEISKKVEFNQAPLDFYPIVQKMPSKIDKRFVFGKAFILEIERGCPFKCKFCSVGKVRYRKFEDIAKIIDEGIRINKPEKVVIYSASFTHPKRKEILEYLIGKDIRVGVPSIKAEVFDSEIMKLISKLGQKSLTFAPECGERLRYGLGKMASDKKFFEIAGMTKDFSIKLYFMIGLPDMNEKDLDEIVEFVHGWKEINPRVYVSVNPFVSKPNTEFKGFVFDRKRVKTQEKYLRSHLKGRVKFSSISFAEKIWKIANFK